MMCFVLSFVPSQIPAKLIKPKAIPIMCLDIFYYYYFFFKSTFLSTVCVYFYCFRITSLSSTLTFTTMSYCTCSQSKLVLLTLCLLDLSSLSAWFLSAGSSSPPAVWVWWVPCTVTECEYTRVCSLQLSATVHGVVPLIFPLHWWVLSWSLENLALLQPISIFIALLLECCFRQYLCNKMIS